MDEPTNYIYQAIHSDFKALKEVNLPHDNSWRNFELKINPRTDAIFSASKTAQKGLKEGFGYDSVVVPNILAKADTDLRAKGYKAEFAVGFEEAKQIIDDYLGNNE